MSQPASESENDIHVEIDVPAAEPETPEPVVEETPAVVVVGSGDSAPDGILPVLMALQEKIGLIEARLNETTTVAYQATAEAFDAAFVANEVQAEVAEIAADVEEALEEEQAPADADESPRKAHWLHR